MGGLIWFILGAQNGGAGQKLRNHLKKSKPFYRLKFIVPNLF